MPVPTKKMFGSNKKKAPIKTTNNSAKLVTKSKSAPGKRLS